MSHTQKLEKSIGLEFEYFLKNFKGELVFPSDYGFPTDEFIILAECRVPPANTLHDVMGNFYREWYSILERADSLKLEVFMSEGYQSVTPQFYSTILKRIKVKEISTCSNIYKTDILQYSDTLVNDEGTIIEQRLSNGLHIHFGLDMVAHYYNKVGKKQEVIDSIIRTSILTPKHRVKIIKWFDKVYLPHSVHEMPTLKYRQRGFYEVKPWGFEYRSLPFNYYTFARLSDIVRDAFKLLDLE